MKYASNIAAVAALKPDYMGFIFYEKSPRYISDVSAELIKYVPSEIKTVGVFVDEDLKSVVDKINLYQLKALQLHGQESPDYCSTLRNQFAQLEIIMAFGIDEDFDFSSLEAYLPVVDYFLFDTKTNAHGGSGKIFNWKILERYDFEKPYFLSGGIDLNHVSALGTLNDPRLYAFDINSKFEVEPGVKDVEKISAFQATLTARSN